IWEAAPDADIYRVQVSLVEDFSTVVNDQNYLTDTSAQVSGLEYSTTYFWRVRGTNAAGNGEYSPVWRFTTEAAPVVLPGAPVLVSPMDLAIGVLPESTLEWEEVAGADHYHLQISHSAGFESVLFDQDGILLTTSQVPGLALGTQYFWRVRATNNAGDSEWSQTWSFTTVSEEGTLVGHWKMDEGSGTTVADASMYGNHAQLAGTAERVPGVHGQALRFSGNNQYAAAPDHPSLDITGAITLAAWVRPENTDTQYLIRKAQLDADDGYELTMTKGTVFFRFNQASGGMTGYRLN